MLLIAQNFIFSCSYKLMLIIYFGSSCLLEAALAAYVRFRLGVVWVWGYLLALSWCVLKQNIWNSIREKITRNLIEKNMFKIAVEHWNCITSLSEYSFYLTNKIIHYRLFITEYSNVSVEPTAGGVVTMYTTTSSMLLRPSRLTKYIFV